MLGNINWRTTASQFDNARRQITFNFLGTVMLGVFVYDRNRYSLRRKWHIFKYCGMFDVQQSRACLVGSTLYVFWENYTGQCIPDFSDHNFAQSTDTREHSWVYIKWMFVLFYHSHWTKLSRLLCMSLRPPSSHSSHIKVRQPVSFRCELASSRGAQYE